LYALLPITVNLKCLAATPINDNNCANDKYEYLYEWSLS